MLTRPIRLAVHALVMLATFVAAYFAVIALPHDPYIRYQSFQGTIFTRLKWVYERIHFDPAPVDILITGASREGAGIVAPELEAELRERGRPYRVANFSLPASGMDIRLTILREVLETKKPKLVIVSVVEQLPRDGHQAFGDLARPGEILAAPRLINRTLPNNLARLPIRQIELALATRVPATFGYQAGFDPLTYKGTSFRLTPAEVHGAAPPASHLTMSPQAHLAWMEAESAKARASMRPPLLPERFGDLEFGVSRHYLKAVKDLAEANGAKVVFVFLPFFKGYSEPLDRAWLDGLAPIWSTDQFITDPLAFKDMAHMRDEATPAIADWLATRIDETLP